MSKKILFVLMPLFLSLAACAPAASSPDTFTREAIAEGVAPAAPEFEAVPMEEAGAFDEDQSFQGGAGETIERLVIKNASMEIVVDAPNEAMESISQLAESFGGYVVSANLFQNVLSGGQEVPRASITIRVPAGRLDEAMARIEEESDRLPLNKNIQSQDITSDYTDLKSRLRNLEAAESQLMEIMDSANKTEDVLNVFNQLTSVREQIEVVKGQIQYYDQSVALSSISVELIANAAVQPITTGGWEPVGVVKDAIEALIEGLQILATAGIWLILVLVPILLVILLPIYLIVRLVIRRRRKGRTESPAAAG